MAARAIGQMWLQPPGVSALLSIRDQRVPFTEVRYIPALCIHPFCIVLLFKKMLYAYLADRPLITDSSGLRLIIYLVKLVAELVPCLISRCQSVVHERSSSNMRVVVGFPRLSPIPFHQNAGRRRVRGISSTTAQNTSQIQTKLKESFFSRIFPLIRWTWILQSLTYHTAALKWSGSKIKDRNELSKKIAGFIIFTCCYSVKWHMYNDQILW